MKQFLLILLSFNSLFIFAQENDKKQIAEDSRNFMEALNKMNIDYYLDMTYPKVFELNDRETLKQTIMESLEGNEELKMEFINIDTTVFEVSEIFIIQNSRTRYAFVTYPFSMKMTFYNQVFDDYTKEMMKMMMESDYMKIDFVDDNSILMYQKGMMIAINDEFTSQTWKYVNYDDEDLNYLSILPEEIVNNSYNYFAAYLQR